MRTRIGKNAKLAVLTAVTATLLTACEMREENGSADSGEVEQQAEVIRIDADEAREPAPETTAIRSVAFARGSTLDITNIDIVGDIMTVEFRARNQGNNHVQLMQMNQVNYIEDQTSRKVEALQDADGRYMANPVGGSGRILTIRTDGGVGWIKFPRPDEGVTSISLTIPEAGALNALPVPAA